MASKKCDGILENKKVCGAETFFDEIKGEQCPKECAHCGHVLNPYFDEEKEGVIAESFETKYNDLVEEHKELSEKYNKLIAEIKTGNEAKVTKTEVKK